MYFSLSCRFLSLALFFFCFFYLIIVVSLTFLFVPPFSLSFPCSPDASSDEEPLTGPVIFKEEKPFFYLHKQKIETSGVYAVWIQVAAFETLFVMKPRSPLNSLYI